jgi:tetratricopeptide (TPR) repeat protein
MLHFQLMFKPLAAAVMIQLLAAVTAVAGPRIAFVRTVAPSHDLGGEQVALIYALGDNEGVGRFLDVFVEHTNRTGALRVTDGVERGRHFFAEQPGEEARRRIHRDHPADAYLGVNRFTCETTEHQGEGSTADVDGARVKRHHVWIDAVCTARIDAYDGAMKRLLSFQVKGEGTSPRVLALTSEERLIATEQAARYAALSASQAITPRQVREAIELDESAPAFDQAWELIDSSHLQEAKAFWETALKQNRSSAALHYDLGALCEALGDLDAARRYFQEALRLSPDQPRYRSELMAFRHRNDIR